MFFLAQMSLDSPAQWIQCDAKTNRCVLISEQGEETEISSEAWPILVYNFENEHFYCLDNDTKGTAVSQGEVLLYKLILINLKDSRSISFSNAQTLSKHKLSSLSFKASPHLIENQGTFLGLVDKLRQALSINRNTYDAKYKQLTTHFENLSSSSTSPETQPLKDNTFSLKDNPLEDKALPLETIITLSKGLSQALSAQNDILSLQGHLYVPEDSLQFSAMVLTLLQRNISPQTLLESGILGSFYLMNASSAEDISEAYEALKTLSDSRPDVFPHTGNNLFTLAKQHYVKSVGPSGVYQALDGSISKNPLKPAAEKTNLQSPTIDPCQKNIKQLADFFKDDFFLVCITQASNFSDLKDPLSHYLYDSDNSSLDLVKRLQAYSLKSEPIKKLFSLLSLETLETLLMEPEYTAYVLWYLIKHEIFFIDISQLTLPFTITTINFRILCNLSRHPRLAHAKDQLQKALCRFLLSLSSDKRNHLLDSMVLSTLKASPHLSTWVEKQYQLYYVELLKILQKKLTCDTFTDAKNHFEQHWRKIQFLKILFPHSNLIYPESENAFKGLVITEASKKLEELSDILDIVFSHFDASYPHFADQVVARFEAIIYSSEDIQNHYIMLIHQEILRYSLFGTIISNLLMESKKTKKNITAFLLKIIEAVQKTDSQNIINTLSMHYPNNGSLWYSFSQEAVIAVIFLLAKHPENIPALIQSMNTPNYLGKTVWCEILTLDDDITSDDAITPIVTLLATTPENINAITQGMNTTDTNGNTAWHELTTKQIVSIVSVLAKNPKNIPALIEGMNKSDPEGKTVWHILCLFGSDEITSVITLLATTPENVSAITQGMNTPDKNGITAWYELSAEQHTLIAPILGKRKRSESTSTLIKEGNIPSKLYNHTVGIFSNNIKPQQETSAINPTTAISMTALKQILSNDNDRFRGHNLFNLSSQENTLTRELAKFLAEHNNEEVTWGEIQNTFGHYLLGSQQPSTTHINKKSRSVFSELIDCFLEKQKNQAGNSALNVKLGPG